MDDLISRQAALQAMDTWDKFGCGPDGRLVRCGDDKHYVLYVHYDDMVHAIKHLPSAHQEPICVAKVTLTDEQVKEAFEKAKGEILTVLDAQPERKKGKWIDEGFYADGHGAHAFRCSECGGHIIEYDEDPFCRWCGADMRQRKGEQDD